MIFLTRHFACWIAAQHLRRALLTALAGFALLTLAACDSVEERVARHHAEGLAHLAAGEPGKALISFRSALNLDPDLAQAHHQIGLILESRNEIEQAFASFRKAADLNPDLVDPRIKVAEYLIVSGELSAAETELRSLASDAPRNAEIMALQASIALRRDQLGEAAALLAAAEAIAPESLRVMTVGVGLAIKAGDEAEALARVDKALVKHPDRVGLYQKKVELQTSLNDVAGIGETLRAMADRFPSLVSVQEALVLWATESGRPEKAEAALRALILVEPENLDRIADLARFMLKEQGVSATRAELAAHVAAETDPDRRGALVVLQAAFELEHGSHDAAVALLRELAGRGGAQGAEARLVLAQLALRDGNAAAADAELAAILADDPRHLGALRLRVARLIEEGALEEALRVVRVGLEGSPEDVELLELNGRAHERLGHLDLANDRFAKAVRAADFAPSITERYVGFLDRSNRLSGAEVVLAEAVSRSPKEARLWELLGSVRLSLGNWTGVEAAATALEALDSDRARELRTASLIRQERFEEGVALIRMGGEAARNRAASISQTVAAHIAQGEAEEAAVFLDEIIAADSSNLQALELRGNLHVAAGEYVEGSAKYRLILGHDPANAGAYFRLARLVETERGLDEAAAVLEEGIAASPNNLALMVRLAQYRERQGDIDAAIGLYERAYGQAPDSLMVANNLASLLADYHAEDLAKVARAVSIASRLQGVENSVYRDTYGWTRHLAGEHETALKELSTVLEALPENPWVNYHAGMVYAELARTQEAVHHLEAALRFAGETSFAPRERIAATLRTLRQG